MSAEQWRGCGAVPVCVLGQQCRTVSLCVAQGDVVVATCVCAGRHSRIRYLAMHSHMYSPLSFFFSQIFEVPWHSASQF